MHTAAALLRGDRMHVVIIPGLLPKNNSLVALQNFVVQLRQRSVINI
jgi:hypothetical protein